MNALITGASSGIGYELAKLFAASKINLVLVARSEEKLNALAVELKEEFAIEVHVVAKDLSNYNAALEIFDFCKSSDKKISYLVNNAGFGDYGAFVKSDWKKQAQMINLNITALTYLTRLFLPDMIKAGQGKVMNVASIAAFQPGPLMAVYFATKAYVLHFSEAIANEIEGSGVTVTVLCPGPTESGFKDAASINNGSLFKQNKIPTSAEVARYGYKAMMKGKKVAIHGTKNYIMANSVRFTPRSLVTKIVRWMQE
jgi:uncharacterized protein